MKKTKISLALAGMLLTSSASFADEKEDIVKLKKEIASLKEITQTLIDETSDLKTGFNYTVVDTEKSHSGLGAAASKVYYSKSPLSIGGYGEMYYANKKLANQSGSTSTVDVYRFVPYIGYKFSDNIILNTEIEFEHGGIENNGGTSVGGEVILEFMYLDFLINQNANIRVGNFLVPMGLINERHEPTLFTTVQRPESAKYLIPSTWNESGVMAYGDIVESLTYKAALITGLDTAANGEKWIRGGRGGSFKNTDPKIGGTFRVDYTGINGLLLGASLYTDNTLTMWDTHIDYTNSGFRLYGVYTETSRSKTDAFTTPSIAKEAKGGYLNASFDILSLTKSSYTLPLFVQYESLNPQSKTVGTAPENFDTVNITTVGLNFYPHEQVVFKMDYAMADNDYANSGIDSDTFSLSMGFIF
ncbi:MULTISPECIES: porin [Sulfurimonas]|uniref:porin n=1 Tax=Sulfurimonas TaxID=202746 RepID=UPI0012654F61|nr:porin [Sulfurimonas indica]